MQQIRRVIQQGLCFSVALGAAYQVIGPIVFPDLGIAEEIMRDAAGWFDDGIALILFEMNPVLAYGDVLRLLEAVAVVGGARIDQIQLPVLFDRAAGEASSLRVVVIAFARRKRDGQLLPMHQVIADRMPPVHLRPEAAIRVELVEEVVFPLEIDQAVRIVDPSAGAHEMVSLTAWRRGYRRGFLRDASFRPLDRGLHDFLTHRSAPNRTVRAASWRIPCSAWIRALPCPP